MKNKKIIRLTSGFTLIELIGVIIILSLIMLLSVPLILNSIRSSKNELSDASKKILYNAINIYINENLNDFPKIDGNTFCVSIDTLSKKEYLPTDVYDSSTGNTIPSDSLIEVKVENNNYTYNINNECKEYVYTPPYQDNSGANIPELLNNMVPIRYQNDNWIVADISKEWYDYNKKEWANAVVLNSGVTKNVGDIISEDEISLWYVWIPRYKYQLFNVGETGVEEQEIQIKFESGIETTGTVKCEDIDFKANPTSEVSEICTNVMLGNWYTHPAFTFGEQELTGFWVGKFEISGTTDNITIKPNVSSLRNQTVSSFFYSIQSISDIYKLNGDSHMIKNMEWGAVAYLSHSKYGINEEIYVNNSANYYTGRSGGNVDGKVNLESIQYQINSSSNKDYNNYGYYTYDGKIVNYDGIIGEYAADRTLGTKASTTGNIYGVYDMSGGAWEFVMANMQNEDGSFFVSQSGFSQIPLDKYYDKYSYGSSAIEFYRGKLGDATKEVIKDTNSYIGGWYKDGVYFVAAQNPWLDRGGSYNYSNTQGSNQAGIFYFGKWYGNGSTNSSRAILCSLK